ARPGEVAFRTFGIRPAGGSRLRAVQVLEPDGVGRRAQGQALAVGGERQGHELATPRVEDEGGRPRDVQAPAPYGAVKTARNELPPVRAEGHRPDVPLVADQGGDPLVRRGDDRVLLEARTGLGFRGEVRGGRRGGAGGGAEPGAQPAHGHRTDARAPYDGQLEP